MKAYSSMFTLCGTAFLVFACLGFASGQSYEGALTCLVCVGNYKDYDWNTGACSDKIAANGTDHACDSNNVECCATTGCRSSSECSLCCLESLTQDDTQHIVIDESAEISCEKATTSSAHGDCSTCAMILSFPADADKDDITITLTEIWADIRRDLTQQSYPDDIEIGCEEYSSYNHPTKYPAFKITSNETYSDTDDGGSSWGYYYEYSFETYSYYTNDPAKCEAIFEYYRIQVIESTYQSEYDGIESMPYILKGGEGCTEFGKILIFKYAKENFDLPDLSERYSVSATCEIKSLIDGQTKVIPGHCSSTCNTCAMCSEQDEEDLRYLLNSPNDSDLNMLVMLSNKCPHITEESTSFAPSQSVVSNNTASPTISWTSTSAPEQIFVSETNNSHGSSTTTTVTTSIESNETTVSTTTTVTTTTTLSENSGIESRGASEMNFELRGTDQSSSANFELYLSTRSSALLVFVLNALYMAIC